MREWPPVRARLRGAGLSTVNPVGVEEDVLTSSGVLKTYGDALRSVWDTSVRSGHKFYTFGETSYFSISCNHGEDRFRAFQDCPERFKLVQ